jgi:hypothetical protein
MKKILFLISGLVLFSCNSPSYKVEYSNRIETYTVSDKYSTHSIGRGGGHFDYYHICIQSPRNTECLDVNAETYGSLSKGDTLKLLIKETTKIIK